MWNATRALQALSPGEIAANNVVDAMPLLSRRANDEARRVVFTAGEPLDFYGARDGKLHANGGEFHIKGINWCAKSAPLFFTRRQPTA